MKINKPLLIGLILLLFFIIFEVLGSFLFEIRDKDFYSFVIYLELISFLSIDAIIIFGLYKLRNDWKWLVILPFTLFGIIYLLGTIYLPFPNEIIVKEDTELLYINSCNNNKKIVRQSYFTGITGSIYHSDTLVVNDFSPWIRLARPAQTTKIDKTWISVSKPE